MKRLTLSFMLLLALTRLVGQSYLHQDETFIFNNNISVPSGLHIFEASRHIEFQDGSEYNPAPGENLEARINPYLIFPPPGGVNGGPNPGDNGVVGIIPGTLDVTSSGAASYLVPINLPAGLCGMQPNISLQYNSQSGNGMLGIGWTLSGFSMISRTSTDFYRDGVVVGVNGVHFNENDRFVLDGQRLIVVNDLNNGDDGAEYRTEIESFNKIVSHGTAGNGPQWFEVISKDGKRIEYGSTTDSRIEAPGCSDVLFWLVSKISDPQGNYVSFEYNESDEMTFSPQRIIYTGNESINPSIEPFFKMEFVYESRPDVYRSYMAGSFVNTMLRLKKIVIKHIPSSQIYKEYTLVYNNNVNSTITTISEYHSRIEKIEVSDGNGTHLNPTVFTWGSLNEPFKPFNVLPADSYDIYPGDFNGDGKTDNALVYYYYDDDLERRVYTTWELWLANSYGSGFIKYQNAGGESLGDGHHSFLIGDFNGDGLSDVMKLYDNWWDEDPPSHYHSYVSLAKTGNSGFEGFFPFQPVEGIALSAPYRFRGEQVGDFNGDGINDIAIRCSHKSDTIKYDDEYDCKVFFMSFNNFTNTINASELVTNITSINKFFVGFFYDKTRSDLLVLKEGHTRVYYFDKQTYSFAQVLPESGNYPSKYHTVFTRDFNGDGLSDIFTCIGQDNSNALWEISESTGTGFTWPATTLTFLPNKVPNEWDEQYNAFPGDFNGDGLSDIMSIDGANNKVKFFFSKGNGEFILPPEIYPIEVNYATSNKFRFCDYNGDGIEDMLYSIDIYTPKKMLLVHPFDQTNLVKTITDGFGKQEKIIYTPLTTLNSNIYVKYHTTYTTSQANVKDFQGPLNVVSGTMTDNGMGGFLEKAFSYEGARIHRLCGDFLGFSKVTVLDAASHITTKRTFHYLLTDDDQTYPEDFYFPHLIKSETFFEQNLTEVSEYEYKAYQYYPDFTWNPIIRRHFFPFLQKSNSKTWEINGSTYIKTSRTRVVYDDHSLPYGNPVMTKTMSDPLEIGMDGEDNRFTFSEQKAYTYYPYDVQSWIINQVSSVTTQSEIKDNGTQSRLTQYEYYGSNTTKARLLWKEMIEPGDPLGIIRTFDYFPNGNLRTMQVSAPNASPPLESKTTDYEYAGGYHHRFVTKTTDPLGYFTEATYSNLTGAIISKTDINGLTTTYSADMFNIDAGAVYPDGTQYRKVIRWAEGQADAPPYALYFDWEKSSGNGAIVNYYDKLGRILRSVSIGFSNEVIYVDHVYDQMGRLFKTSIPYFSGESPQYTELIYNTSLSRPDQKIFPDQTTESYTYNGLESATTDQAGHTLTRKMNAAGQIEESTDANNGTVTFSYSFSNNNLITRSQIADNPSTLTTIETDKFGNRYKISDLSSGITEERYNAYGERITYKSARQTEHNKTLFTYDLTGRITTRTEEGKVTTWTYDSKPFGKGKPGLVVNADHSIEYFYDELGRVSRQDEKITGETGENGSEQIFSNFYIYDNFSRIEKQTYPSGITTRNHYSNNGYLYKISRPGFQNITLWELKGMNAPGQVTHEMVGNKINTAYNYYPETGRLSSIWSYTSVSDLQDLEYHWEDNGNLKSRKKYLDRSLPLFLEEIFTYDNLDRLHIIDHQDLSSEKFEYDALGNLTEKPPLTGMSYTAPGSGPYGIIAAGFSGSVVPDTPQDITYNLFDKVETIAEGSLSLSMTYGIDHGRIRQIIRRDGMEEERKVYLSGGCEKVTDSDGSRYLTYVGGAQGLCIILVSGKDGETGTYLVLKDHLGSLNCITDAEGNLVEELSFDAWGRRRNPENWSYDNVSSTFLFDRGYTGHEHLDAFGLINMNGRMYDPLSGRFLSTDAYVQAPDFTQSHNRYSYCLNNPLKYADPSGNIAIIDSWIVGFIQGFFSTGSDRWTTGWRTANRWAENDFKVNLGQFIPDKNRTFAGQIWQVLSRFTWELPQTMGGYFSAQFAVYSDANWVKFQNGATVVQCKGEFGGITQGMYIIGGPQIEANPNNPLFQHEYGHYIQSQSMGLAYYSRVGIPSLLSSTEEHKYHPVEQDANRRALLYFNENDGTFQNDKLYSSDLPSENLGWDFRRNPFIDGVGENKYYNNYYPINIVDYRNANHISSLENIVHHAKWYDHLSWIAWPNFIWTGLGNTNYFNN